MTLQTVWIFLTQPVVIVILAVILLLIVGRVVRVIQRRRALIAIDKLPITEVADQNEKDREAYIAIRKFRVDLWNEWEKARDFSPKAFNDLLLNIVKPIAAVYHPEVPDPHFKASVTDLVHLNNRVFNRIRKILEKPFLNKLNRLDLETILTLTKGLNVVLQNPLTKVIRNKEIRKIYRQFFSAINILNPWFWIRRIAIEYSLDLAIRYFITSFITIVGEEAIFVYGKKQQQDQKEIAQRITLLTLIQLINQTESPSSGDYEILYKNLISSKSLEDDEKLELINRLQKGEKISESDCDYRLITDQESRSLLMEALEELVTASNAGKDERMSLIRTIEDYYDRDSSARDLQ